MKYIEKYMEFNSKVNFNDIIVNKCWNKAIVVNVICISHQIKWILMKFLINLMNFIMIKIIKVRIIINFTSNEMNSSLQILEWGYNC